MGLWMYLDELPLVVEFETEPYEKPVARPKGKAQEQTRMTRCQLWWGSERPTQEFDKASPRSRGTRWIRNFTVWLPLSRQKANALAHQTNVLKGLTRGDRRIRIRCARPQPFSFEGGRRRAFRNAIKSYGYDARAILWQQYFMHFPIRRRR